MAECEYPMQRLAVIFNLFIFVCLQRKGGGAMMLQYRNDGLFFFQVRSEEKRKEHEQRLLCLIGFAPVNIYEVLSKQ